jgi:lipoprotein-releasing system permease protein
MNLEFKISSRYLRSNRKKGFISFISGVSMVGLILGVMALVTVLSVMNGFHSELKNRILGAISHSYITEHNGVLNNWQSVREKINQNPRVIASSPYIKNYALLSFRGSAQGISIRGVDLTLEKTTSTLLDKISRGSATLGKRDILIGAGLATQLGANIGDKITLITPKINTSILGVQPRFKRFIVSGIFDAGIGEYDTSLAFIELNQAQKLYNMKTRVSGIRLKVDDLFAAKSITDKVVYTLDANRYYGVDWMAQKSNFIRALQLEKQMIGIILSLIIAVAAFNIVSMMVMVVVDKRADIAVLKTLGMNPKRITKIFFYQGVSIGFIGISIGLVLGILLANNIENIIGAIEQILGFQFFPKDIFYIDRFPSDVHISDIIQIALGAFVLVMLAAIYPAKRAGKIEISKVLNYE